MIGCAAGKDRTRVTIALLLDIAGVPADVIVADYALSAGYSPNPSPESIPTIGGIPPLRVDSPPEFMAGALEHLHRAHGGPRSLLRRQGIADTDLDRLAERLTEPAAS